MNISGGLSQSEEEDTAVVQGILHNGIKKEIVKEEQTVTDYVVKCEICKENFVNETECAQDGRICNLKQEDKMQLVCFHAAVDMHANSSSEDVKPKLENTECSSADKQDDFIIKLIDSDVLVKQEVDTASLEYSPRNEDFLECETGQTKTEDDIDTFYENIKIETIKGELVDDEASLHSDMLVQDKDSCEDIKPSSFKETSKDDGSQLYCQIRADKTYHHNQQRNNHFISETHLPSQSKEPQCKFGLKSFEQIHTGEKPFDCTVCSKSFYHRSKLVRHEQIHTGGKPFNCKFCSKPFSRKYILAIHERIHTGDKPFECKVCSKSFYSKSDLVKHERIHTGEKPYDCKICSKHFITSSNLVQHQRTHTGEKPFVCKVCPKTFYDRSQLVRHNRIHTGEKPFDCKVCSKPFFSRSKLVTHERIHTGEKPFHCTVCSKSFSTSSNRSQHEKTHAKEKPFR